MTYAYDFDQPPPGTPEERRSILGGKGAGLAEMRHDLGLPVPPGFTISTEACRIYLADGWPAGLDDELRAGIAAMEEAVGRSFGGPGEPLLVSVRSGATVSMPGMMDTILNLGLDEATTAELATLSGDPEFARSCRQRLLTMYRDIVGVADVPDDPWQQLRGAIEAVFRSWNNDRARVYRAREGIPDDLGTAVTVQTMVFGNWGPDSATGVVFTRDPATGKNGLYGDIMFRAQGEDVVAGTHTPEPIAVLAEWMPDLADELQRYGDLLERHYRDVCDIEFTIERGKLWMLQVRNGKRTPQAALRIAVEMAEDDDFPLTRAEAVERVAHHLENPPSEAALATLDVPFVATGLGASGGLASGSIATSADEALRMADGGESVILVRPATSPDDVHGMARAVGILTTNGGLTSHAAVVARGWGIPAVVGATQVEVTDGTVRIGPVELRDGDPLTIDGGTGKIYAGLVIAEARPIPAAATLLDWANELGMRIPIERSENVAEGSNEHGEGPRPEAVITALNIKGFATPDLLAPAVLASEESLAPVTDELSAAGLITQTSGMWQLTAEGKARAAELMAADIGLWGVEAAAKALDSFIPLDKKMKEIVTAWQMREVGGQQVMNDHTDEDYDMGVLDDFAELHDYVARWIEPLAAGLTRLGDYATRLDQAAARADDGEHAYIASPRVDSYHSIWFELHEDLIRLAGRTREEETAAGRA